MDIVLFKTLEIRDELLVNPFAMSSELLLLEVFTASSGRRESQLFLNAGEEVLPFPSTRQFLRGCLSKEWSLLSARFDGTLQRTIFE